MKIGIVTIQDNKNYGNRLQNYAVQEVLRSNGHRVKTIRNSVYYNTRVNAFRMLAWRILRQKRLKKKAKMNRERVRHFSEFNRNITFTKGMYAACYHYDKYDYYLVGSDQVWNPDFRLSEMDVLAFAKPEKRIAFSASFGVEGIPEYKRHLVQNEISRFKAISVREDAGKKIIEELTGRTDVQVLIDPTMLLCAEQWDRVAKKPEMLGDGPFVLNYFLGKGYQEQLHEIDAFAAERGYQVINILDPDSPFYACGPSEFLFLEKHAELICTDSFHSSVFAVLYDRPFIVYERPAREGQSMNSRLETLIRKLHLTGRRYGGRISEENLHHDYTESYALLEQEREKTFDFLKTALGSQVKI